MAERTGVAIVGIRHLNKAQGTSPIYRGGGSIAIIGAARASFLVAKDPDDPETRVFAPNKCNLAPHDLDALQFKLTSVVGSEDGITVPTIAWSGISERKAHELLTQPQNEDDRSIVDDATEFLDEFLCDGPKPTRDVQSEAKRRGFSWRTISRAKVRAGVESEKSTFGGGWVLRRRMPTMPASTEQKNLASLASLAPLVKDQQVTSQKLETDSEGCQQNELALLDAAWLEGEI
jgi:hypothetical protein